MEPGKIYNVDGEFDVEVKSKHGEILSCYRLKDGKRIKERGYRIECFSVIVLTIYKHEFKEISIQ